MSGPRHLLPVGHVGLALAALAALAGARPARAQDAFEIQVYDVEITPPGKTALELHENFVVSGRTLVNSDGEAPTNHVYHLALEPHIGITNWLELGAYLQIAVRPDGLLDYAGYKFRLKARLPGRVAHGHLGFALNAEFSDIPTAYEFVRYGSEIRPIVDLRAGRFFAALNPILGIDLAGPLAGHPQLQPAAKVAVRIVSTLYAGAEYYGAIGPIDAPFAASQQVHRLFGVLDYELSLRHLRLAFEAGAGYGFSAGDKLIVKTIIGIDGGEFLPD